VTRWCVGLCGRVSGSSGSAADSVDEGLNLASMEAERGWSLDEDRDGEAKAGVSGVRDEVPGTDSVAESGWRDERVDERSGTEGNIYL
jgi:hypothetical protein